MDCLPERVIRNNIYYFTDENEEIINPILFDDVHVR